MEVSSVASSKCTRAYMSITCKKEQFIGTASFLSLKKMSRYEKKRRVVSNGEVEDFPKASGSFLLLQKRRMNSAAAADTKKKNMKGLAAVVLVAVLVLPLRPCQGALQEGYYKGKCGSTDVEDTIKNVVLSRFNQDRSIVAALLRMQFHDCFVKGCDASILLDGNSSEKTAIPNLNVRGYDIIDEAKAALEKTRPGVVSCVDIIIAATRDAISFSGGERYEIQTGRKDGLVSQASNVNLPSPSISVSDSIAAFATKGLTTEDMVLLLGGHTVGVAHCSLFQDRLYNYQGTGQRDPNMSLLLAITLSLRCPKNENIDDTANLDQNPLSALVVDNDYYKQLLLRRGVLQIDQALAMDARTRPTVASLASRSDFTSQFVEAMIKLGAVEVLTDEQGQIRRSCRSVN